MTELARQMASPLTPQRSEVEWLLSRDPVPYEEAVCIMEARADAIARGEASECVWLLQHPSLYTAGTSARPKELLTPSRFPVHRSGRGGRFTYHGPGQRIAYVMLDLDSDRPGRGRDLRCHVWRLEEWIIATLRRFNVTGGRRDGRVGVWIARADQGGHDDKIAAIGVRVRHWVTYHGVALNVAPDLDQYRGIIPCGVAPESSGHGVTSLARLGIPASMSEIDKALRATFAGVFGAAAACASNT